MRQYTVTIRCMYEVYEGEINYLFAGLSLLQNDVRVNNCGQVDSTSVFLFLRG